MGLSEKQYDAMRAQAIEQAKARGISEKQVDNYKGELFPGEREYLIRMNPPGAKTTPPPSRSTLVLLMAVVGTLLTFI